MQSLRRSNAVHLTTALLVSLLLIVPSLASAAGGPNTNSGQNQVYYIAAEKVDWNYAPWYLGDPTNIN